MSASGHGSCRLQESNTYFADNDLGNGAITYLDLNGQKFLVRLWWIDWNWLDFTVIDFLRDVVNA